MIINNDYNKKGFNMNNNFQKKINNSQASGIITDKKDHLEDTPNSIKTHHENVFTKDIFSMAGGNASNSNDMYDKSIAMLHDRLEKGLISMDEFSKKCNEIAKKRNNL